MRHWTDEAQDQLLRTIPCGYAPSGPPCTEPTALAALALVARGQHAPAEQCTQWMARLQGADGSVGTSEQEKTPCWPTALASLAWQASDRQTSPKYGDRVRMATEWIIQAEGLTLDPNPQMGHDPTLPAWSWVEDTHSWIEPTAWHVLALKAAGSGRHSRARFGVVMLTDRLLTTGGCNYGNTIVLGQQLRPHVQPTGLTMLALAGEDDSEGKVAKSLDYLGSELSISTTTASLCYGLIGLAAHDRSPPQHDAWLEAAFRRTSKRDRSPLKLGLLLLAAMGARNPLLTMTRSISDG